MYVDDFFRQYPHVAPPSGLTRASQQFENTIFPQVVERFGELRLPPGTPAPRITVLNTNIQSVGGYYNATDLLPKTSNPFSNERLMLYMNVSGKTPGIDEYAVTLAHELQHAVHALSDPTEEGWVNEGLSTLAEQIIVQESRYLDYFSRQPDTQLTHWDRGVINYASPHVFFAYLLERFGGSDPWSLTKALVAEQADGIEGIEAVLERISPGTSFEDVFADWVTANYLGAGHGDLGYRDLDLEIAPIATINGYGNHAERVNQFGADYISIKPGSGGARIVFQGESTNSLLPFQGYFGPGLWWSNRGDNIETSLSRSFDLTGVESATLDFWIWHFIEDYYDRLYVEASGDGGVSWDVLGGRLTTTEDPTSTAIGPSYTGISGNTYPPEWLLESIDLSPYAGRTIDLRFRYLTDQTLEYDGAAIHNISIPDIGFHDNSETLSLWHVEGFHHTNNVIPQKFVVRAIVFGPKVQVLNVPISATGRGEILAPGLGDSFEEIVLVVAGVSPATTIPASYSVTVAPLP